jgi:hypothetical protein
VSLKNEVKALRTISTEQAKAIVSLKTNRGGGTGVRGSSSRCWSSYSVPHRSVKRKRLVTEMKTALSFCDDPAFS